MSSYGGRPAGTDGSDHWHRESVAWQYKIRLYPNMAFISAPYASFVPFMFRDTIDMQGHHFSINKSRLKSSLVLQILLGLVVIVRLLPGLTALIGLPIYRRLQHWDFPAPKAWEYAWIVSLLAAFFGLKSLPRNDSLVLKQFLIGTAVFGILPVLYGVIELFDDLVLYYNERKFSAQIVGYPAVLVWYFGLILCLQIHIFSMYFGVNLLKAWKPRAKKVK